MRLVFFILFILSYLFSYSQCNQEVASDSKKTYIKGEKFYKKRNIKESLSFLHKSINYDKNNANAYFLLGQIYYEREQFDKSEYFFLKGVDLCPSYSSSVYFMLYDINIKNNKYDKAKDNLLIYLKFLDLDQDERDRALVSLKNVHFRDSLLRNPVPFDISSVKGVSTKFDEVLPILSPDNELMFFTRRKKIKNKGDIYEKVVEELTKSVIYDGEFGVGEPLPSPFNINENEGGGSISIYNTELYLTVCVKSGPNNYRNCDIFFSEFKNENWTDLESIGNHINGLYTWESQPSISSDGNMLIFASNRDGGFGKSDLYYCVRLDNGWSRPYNMGKNINTKGSEKSPFLHPDNKTLYFSSNGRLGMGGLDIYFSRMDDDKVWSKPVNIGYPINSLNQEVGFFVSTDGEKAYFSSNIIKGGAGGWDLYSFPLYSGAQPKKVLFIKGYVSVNDSVFSGVSVNLKNVSTGKMQTIPVDSITGRYVALMTLEANEDVFVSLSKKGYSFNSLYIDGDDKKYSAPTDIDFHIEDIKLNSSYRINDVHFEHNSFVLNKKSQFILGEFAEYLKDNSALKVSINGHTDNVGGVDFNYTLSEKRAQASYYFLVDKGINENRLSYKGFGESDPVSSNKSEEGRSLNRRTEFMIIGK